MKCYVCGETLRGAYFTYKGQPICEKDYKVCVTSFMKSPKNFLLFCCFTRASKHLVCVTSFDLDS